MSNKTVYVGTAVVTAGLLIYMGTHNRNVPGPEREDGLAVAGQPGALDPGAQASAAFGINYTNTHILIDKDGQIVKFIPGDIREQDVLSLIQ